MFFEPVKNERFRRESPEGNNNNSNAVDVDVQKCEQIRHAIIQFRNFINPRLPVEEMKKSNRVVGECPIDFSMFFCLLLCIFFLSFLEPPLYLRRFFFIFRIRVSVIQCREMIFNQMSNVFLSSQRLVWSLIER